MAKDKGSDEIKKELTHLWKKTVDQLDEIKDVLVKTTETAQGKIETELKKRERDKLFQKLGEQVAAGGDLVGLPDDWQETLREILKTETEMDEDDRAFTATIRAGFGESAPPSAAQDATGADDAAPSSGGETSNADASASDGDKTEA